MRLYAVDSPPVVDSVVADSAEVWPMDSSVTPDGISDSLVEVADSTSIQAPPSVLDLKAEAIAAYMAAKGVPEAYYEVATLSYEEVVSLLPEYLTADHVGRWVIAEIIPQ